MKLTFSTMRDISDLLHTNQEQKFCDFLNSFEGDSIMVKFKNILESWEYHVSPYFVIANDSKKMNLSLDYIIKYLTPDLNADKSIFVNDFEIKLQTPRKFEVEGEIIPIYNILKSIKTDKFNVDLNTLSEEDQKKIIDILPAHLYTDIIHHISMDQSKILKFENLPSFKFNFYTFDTYYFLKNIFSNYRREYFQDIIYHLSKKIGYDAIVSSNLNDIDYYITKYNDEMEQQRKNTSSLD